MATIAEITIPASITKAEFEGILALVQRSVPMGVLGPDEWLCIVSSAVVSVLPEAEVNIIQETPRDLHGGYGILMDSPAGCLCVNLN
jgi:hypothetical protein